MIASKTICHKKTKFIKNKKCKGIITIYVYFSMCFKILRAFDSMVRCRVVARLLMVIILGI